MNKEVTLKMVRDHSGSQNSLQRMKKSDQQQNQIFISRQQRFPKINSSKNQEPGPGAYIDPLARSRQIQNLRNSPKKTSSNHLDSFVSRQHQWIFGSNRLNLSHNGSGLGPGAYDISEKNPERSMKGWSKSDRFSGNQWNRNNSQIAIGPGSYNPSYSNFTRQKKNQMGIFKSKSPKTFLQKIQKDIQKSLDVKGSSNGFQPFSNNQSILDESDLVKSQVKETKKNKLDPSFLSSSKRYELINPQNGIAGPGSYELDAIVKSRTKKIKSISTSLHYHNKKPQNRSKKIQKQPGPCSYNIDKYNLERQMKKKISSLKGNLSLEQRFKSDPRTKSITLPGPGHYNRQRYMFIDEKDYQHKPLVNHHEKVQIPFLSSSSRVKQQTKLSPFGSYNLNVFDMSEKIKRKRHHIQKLRAMDISVPGFESSQRRTAFNLGKLMKQQFQKLKGSGNIVQNNVSSDKI